MSETNPLLSSYGVPESKLSFPSPAPEMMVTKPKVQLPGNIFHDARNPVELIGMVMGFATMCWENTAGAGELDTARAQTGLEHAINRLAQLSDQSFEDGLTSVTEEIEKLEEERLAEAADKVREAEAHARATVVSEGHTLTPEHQALYEKEEHERRNSSYLETSSFTVDGEGNKTPTHNVAAQDARSPRMSGYPGRYPN